MSSRAHNLDGLRGLAALVVVLHHSLIAFDFALYSGRAEHSRVPWDIALSGMPFTTAALGDLAVCIFFALSGYVLAGSISRTQLGVAALVAKRFTRLGLPIFVVVLVAWALLRLGANQNHVVAGLTRSVWLDKQAIAPTGIWTALEDGFYGALLLGHSRYDTALWTMPIEFQGSLVLIACFLGSRLLYSEHGSGRNLTIILLICFTILFHGSLLCLFTISAAAYLLDWRARAEGLCQHGLVAAALIVTGLALGTLPFSAARPEWIDVIVGAAPISYSVPMRRMDPESFWHALGALLIFVAAEGNPGLRVWFSRRALQFLGEISFPLYLVHMPILVSFGCATYLMLLGLGFPIGAATLLAVLLSSGMSVLVATVLTWTVERAAIRGSSRVGKAVQDLNGFVMSRLLRLLPLDRFRSAAIRRSASRLPTPGL